MSALRTIVEAALWVMAVPAAAGSGYLLLLTLLSARMKAPKPARQQPRFDLIVPAHNEEAGIASTVQSLLAVDYPRELFQVVVVADNCSDATAERARVAGAKVLERQSDAFKGKGYALAHAFEQSLASFVDAVVVVDADTLVTRNLLRAFAVRLEEGAGAVQADYSVRNPNDSWRTRLMAIAFSMFHELRSLGRERLGLSCGLRGNGMCFSTPLLKQVPHEAFSIVEDVEYGIRLGEAGHRVHYAWEANVYGEMVVGEKASRSQRQRWESGRAQLARLHGSRLLRAGLARGSAVLFDLGVDVLFPPLSFLAIGVAAGLLLSIAISGASALTCVWALFAAALFLYVARGWMLSSTGLGGLGALLAAPFYVAWKLALMVKKRTSSEWVRTSRQGSPP